MPTSLKQVINIVTVLTQCSLHQQHHQPSSGSRFYSIQPPSKEGSFISPKPLHTHICYSPGRTLRTSSLHSITQQTSDQLTGSHQTLRYILYHTLLYISPLAVHHPGKCNNYLNPKKCLVFIFSRGCMV